MRAHYALLISTVAAAYTDIGYTDKMSEDRTFSTKEASAGYPDNFAQTR